MNIFEPESNPHPYFPNSLIVRPGFCKVDRPDLSEPILIRGALPALRDQTVVDIGAGTTHHGYLC